MFNKIISRLYTESVKSKDGRYVYQSDDLKSYMIASSPEEAIALAEKILAAQVRSAAA